MKSILKDIEISYSIISGSEEEELKEFDYTQESNFIQVDKDQRKVKLVFRFFTEARNTVNLCFKS
jgi:hypothetical protein